MNIFMAFLILLGIHIYSVEFFDKKNYLPDFSVFYWCFDKLDIVFITWTGMFLISLLVLPLVQAVRFCKLPPLIYLPWYFTLQIMLYSFAVYRCFKFTLPPASALIVSCEMARIGMKMHAYTRDKLVHGLPCNKRFAEFVPKFAAAKGVTPADLDAPIIKIGDLTVETKRFLYFFFCPSLVYRDRYPMTTHINWFAALKHFSNVAFMMLYMWTIFEAIAIPLF